MLYKPEGRGLVNVLLYMRNRPLLSANLDNIWLQVFF